MKQKKNNDIVATKSMINWQEKEEKLFRKQLNQYENLVAMWPFGLYYQPINSGGSAKTSKCQW